MSKNVVMKDTFAGTFIGSGKLFGYLELRVVSRMEEIPLFLA